jgi:hypothetical protein
MVYTVGVSGMSDVHIVGAPDYQKPEEFKLALSTRKDLVPIRPQTPDSGDSEKLLTSLPRHSILCPGPRRWPENDGLKMSLAH